MGELQFFLFFSFYFFLFLFLSPSFFFWEGGGVSRESGKERLNFVFLRPIHRKVGS